MASALSFEGESSGLRAESRLVASFRNALFAQFECGGV